MGLSRAGSVALAIGTFALSSTAAAQTLTPQKGYALDRFDPSDRGSEWFVADSLDFRGHPRLAAGIVGSWAYKPLVINDANGTELAALVEHQLFLHPGASLVLWNRLRAAVNLPIAPYQDGARVVAGTTVYQPPSGALGDLRLAGDLRIFGEHLGPITTAVGAAVYLPTGSRDDYTSDGAVRVSPRVSVAGDISVLSYALRVAYAHRSLGERFAGRTLGSELTGSVAVGARVADPNLVVGPEIFGATPVADDAFFKRRGTQLEWLLGAHYTKSAFRFGGGVGTGLTRDSATSALRAMISVEWTPGFGYDDDNDGIKNDEDACPRIAGPPALDPQSHGCPIAGPKPLPFVAAVPDRDGDGVPDRDDACPTVFGVASAERTKNGCPADRDDDGIRDVADACPDQAGVKSDDPKKNGCPADRDGDGIYDGSDACPETPGEASSDPVKNGCPADRDGDGIYDKEDACPDAQGPADPDPKHNGCPLARIEDGQIKIIEQVQFKSNSAELLRDSDTTLLAVATILKAHPEIAKVRIEGHSDNRGKEEHNRELSYRRALAVENWLVKFGVAKKRFESLGYGPSRPIASNNTDDGRETNRRVEFHITSRVPVTPTAPAAPQTPKLQQ